MTNSTSIGCVDLLENGQADLIVVNYPNSRLTNLVHRKPLRTFQDVFVASRRFFDLENVSLSLKDLQNYPILMLDRKSTTSEYLHQLFQQHQLDLVPEIELSSNDLLLDLASIGLGIAFVPDFFLDGKSQDLFRLNIREELPGRQLVLAYQEQIPLPQAAAEFIRYF